MHRIRAFSGVNDFTIYRTHQQRLFWEPSISVSVHGCYNLGYTLHEGSQVSSLWPDDSVCLCVSLGLVVNSRVPQSYESKDYTEMYFNALRSAISAKISLEYPISWQQNSTQLIPKPKFIHGSTRFHQPTILTNVLLEIHLNVEIFEVLKVQYEYHCLVRCDKVKPSL
jgi:hypothetical protein